MKIIAHGKLGYDRQPKKVLIEADAKEVANLFGCHNVGDHASYLAPAKLAIGTDRFHDIAEKLREAAASVDEFPKLYADLSIPEKPE